MRKRRESVSVVAADTGSHVAAQGSYGQSIIIFRWLGGMRGLETIQMGVSFNGVSG